jgi:predicted O-methyltransferase YrrM
MTGPVRPLDADWLALREPADAQARVTTQARLLPALTAQLSRRGGEGPVRIVDLGAGTGSGVRWLAPRLPLPQRWTLLDHDEELLSRAVVPVPATPVVAGVERLDELLDNDGADLVTATALLDLLDQQALETVVETVARAGALMLFSLTVTGAVALDPVDAMDASIAAAFDRHQRRDGLLGPDAVPVAVRELSRRGFTVAQEATPWFLTPNQRQVMLAWLDGRVQAAVEVDSQLRVPVREWLERRREQLDRGSLWARVDHVDLLALPSSTQ